MPACSRCPAPAPVRVTHTAQLRALLRERSMVVDLRHGVANASALSRDLAAQMPAAVAAEAGAGAPAPRAAGPGFAAAAARGIDAESAGDGTRARAAALGKALARRVRPDQRLDIVLLHGDEAGAEQAMVQALRQALRGSAVRLIDAWAQAAEPRHTAWPGRLVPGLVTNALLRALPPAADDAARLVALQQGHWLLPVEWLPDRAAAPPLDYDRLAATPQLPDWLRAYAQMHGGNHFVDIDLLVRQAWVEFEQGAKDLAFAMLARARQVARDPLRQATVQCHLQGMRIADLRFAQAAAEPPPAPQLPGAVRSFLLLAKGWGCVLEGRAAEGEALLEQGQDVAAYAPGSRERLYIDNIRALARFRQGDVARALALEQHIARELGERSDDAQLVCVNGLNLARLHAARGEAAQARRQYERAFDTAYGVYTDAELLYRHVCLARCLQAEGEVARARLEWLRAALYWLSDPGRLTLSRRIAAIVGGRPWTDAESAALAVSDTLLHGLQAGGTASRAAPAPSALRVLRVHRSEQAAGGCTLHHRGGITVLAGGPLDAGADSADADDSLQALADATAAALRECLGTTPLAEGATLGLPMRSGFPAPWTDVAAVAEGLRLGLARAHIDDRLIVLPPPAQTAWWVRANPAACAFDGDRYGLELRFRRHRGAVWLQGQEAEAMLHLRGCRSLPLQALAQRLELDADAGLAVLRQLESQGLVEPFLQALP